jgi:STE24 endopeptidase
MNMALFAVFTAVLIVLRVAAELWLAGINRRFVLRHAGSVPDGFENFIQPDAYRRSVEYTLAKGRFGQVQDVYSAAVLAAFLFSGVLPWLYECFTGTFGSSVWVMGAFLFTVGVMMSIPSLPMGWLAQFRIEERFGFNTSTQKTWWMDRLKGLILALLLGYPLIVLILKTVEWAGSWWWFGAWLAVLGFQLLMAVLAPILILPLFNRFTPLPEGSLRERLLKLAARTHFRAKSIQVMDGSKRSRHSNAFFTGFGGFRKIVLFDTLIEQLSEPELESVLAHEIGHFKKKHIPKMLVFSAVVSLAGFYALSILARQDWFCAAFGLPSGNIAPALLLFVLLSGLVTFWLSPLGHWLSRRYEYEADAFAAGVMGSPVALIGALRKLNAKNLSNLTPHPIYSGFYYSHPTLREREDALARSAPAATPT